MNLKMLSLILALMFIISCFPRNYLVQPQQIINCKDPAVLEKILESKSVQNMNFTIKVEDVTVEKKLEPKVSLK